MNRIFGFFRDKLAQAKEENQNQLQNLVTAFDVQPYSKSKMLSNMQQIKTNYLEWTIMIANQASTGLYYAQLHNKNCALKKAKGLKENQGRLNKNQIVLQQMHKTIKELGSIDRLNKEWANDMNRKVQKLSCLAMQQRKKFMHKNQKMVRVNSREQEQIPGLVSQQGESSNKAQPLSQQVKVVNEIIHQLIGKVQRVQNSGLE